LFVIGNESVGKTILLQTINQLPSENETQSETEKRMGRNSTIGIDIHEIDIDRKMKVQSWDLGGQEVRDR